MNCGSCNKFLHDFCVLLVRIKAKHVYFADCASSSFIVKNGEMLSAYFLAAMWEQVKEVFGGVGRQYQYAYPTDINDVILALPLQFEKYMKPHHKYNIIISMKARYMNGSKATFIYPMFVLDAQGDTDIIVHHMRDCSRELIRRLNCNERKLERNKVEGVAYIRCGSANESDANEEV